MIEVSRIANSSARKGVATMPNSTAAMPDCCRTKRRASRTVLHRLKLAESLAHMSLPWLRDPTLDLRLELMPELMLGGDRLQRTAIPKGCFRIIVSIADTNGMAIKRSLTTRLGTPTSAPTAARCRPRYLSDFA